MAILQTCLFILLEGRKIMEKFSKEEKLLFIFFNKWKYNSNRRI